MSEPWNLTEAQRRQFREAHAEAKRKQMTEETGPWPAIRDEMRRKAASACLVCNDTGTVISPDPGGESAYESACPGPVHDGEDVTFPADSAPSTPLDDWNW